MVTLESYTGARLQPQIRPSDVRTQSINLGPSLTIPLGQVLARKTSDSLFYPVSAPNRVHTIKIAGTLTAGTWRVIAVDKNGKIVVTSGLAYNANAAAIEAALNAVLGASAVAVAIPTDYATGINVTFSGTDYAALAQTLPGVDISALTGATTASVEDGTVYNGTEDGPYCFNIYPGVTDASGNFYVSDSNSASMINVPSKSTQVYEYGTFNVNDLVGFNNKILAAMGGRYDIAGRVHIPN